MALKNAPLLTRLTASQQGGNRGAQLWGVDYRNILYTTYQKTPGGEWSGWEGPDWAGPGYPKQVYELTAAQLDDGCVQLWVVDTRQELWTIRQHTPGGGWEPWKGPGWNNMPAGMRFREMAATRQGGPRGTQFWGITDKGILTSCHQIHSSNDWSPWQDWTPTPEKSEWIEVTAARQGDGKLAVWGLDTKRQLWGMGQKSPGGEWGPWTGPNWLGARRLRNVAACEHPQHGACIWGTDEDYRVVANFQTAPGSNTWSGWSSGEWMSAKASYELTAAGQNNGCVQVWAIGADNVLRTIAQVPPSCGWESGWRPVG